MNRSHAFTLIEIMVTVTIMMILMAVSVVALRSTQANARDQERKSDAEAIARGFEQNYSMDSFGSYKITTKAKGSYPGNNFFKHASGYDYCPSSIYVPCNSTPSGYLSDFLPGVTPATLKTPNNTADVSLISTWYYNTNEATRLSQITGNVINQDYYVYEPLNLDGTMCNAGDCRRFKLYYKEEVTNTMKIIKSRHQ